MSQLLLQILDLPFGKNSNMTANNKKLACRDFCVKFLDLHLVIRPISSLEMTGAYSPWFSLQLAACFPAAPPSSPANSRKIDCNQIMQLQMLKLVRSNKRDENSYILRVQRCFLGIGIVSNSCIHLFSICREHHHQDLYNI